CACPPAPPGSPAAAPPPPPRSRPPPPSPLSAPPLPAESIQAILAPRGRALRYRPHAASVAVLPGRCPRGAAWPTPVAHSGAVGHPERCPTDGGTEDDGTLRHLR